MHGPYFNATNSRRRDFRRELNGFVQIPRFEQIKTGQLFFCFGEGAVGSSDFAISHSYRGRCFNGLQRLTQPPVSWIISCRC